MPYCSIRALAFVLVFVLAGRAFAADPLAAVRSFCRADASGDRLRSHTWWRVAGLVTWELEPAWDHIYLIRGYEVSTPRTQGDEVVCEVKYTVVGEVPKSGALAGERIESHSFRLVPKEPDESWRIVGPPPVPHVFVDRVDREAMATLLDPQGGYTSAPTFVLQLLRGSGWDLPQLDTGALIETSLLQTVGDPEPGDLVFYLDAGQPYHVGLMDADNRVVSATLNAGIRRAPLDAFGGEIVYRRPFPLQAETPLASARPDTTPSE